MMPSNHEAFFNAKRFAVVGHTSAKPFPILSYRALKNTGRRAMAIDSSVGSIDGDPAYPDLGSLPEPADAVIIEVPKEETAHWVQHAADAQIKDVWVHMSHETPEAIAIAARHGINLRTGTCAVMYLSQGFSYHSIHKLIAKLAGRY